ncbi:phage tail assembly protein [Pseudanabaenaceae cyanobacterium LEGE 13415]|nr:phage tail assembly protein [Pseudanabaenaceae cyanobacterium LEGE 13415]
MQTTEFPFVLPQGYIDAEGNLHREGVMRLSTAYDEIAPLRDPRVQANPGYLILILLSRVITQLGTLSSLNPKMLENFFSADLVYLQDFYQRINQMGHSRLAVRCPHCQGDFEVETVPLGEFDATPQTV